MKRFLYIIAATALAFGVLTLSSCTPGGEADISSYEILAIYDETESKLSGTLNFTFYNDTENEITDLKFNLFGNAFREGAEFSPVSQIYKNSAYYAGESYGAMTVENVENCAGWTVAGEDENILIVNLIEPVYPEQRASVAIGYTLALAKINHRTGVTQNTVNLGNFYPVLCAYTTAGFVECAYYSTGDPFMSACANYSVTIDVPETYTAAASGKLESETIAGGRKKCSYSLGSARDFAVVLSDKFEVLTGLVNGVQVCYYYYSDDDAELSLSAACESLEYFTQTFGDYVYPTLSVVQTGFVYGGMEYPALTMISDSLDADNTIYTIVHENAHQWWYAMVGSDQLNCAWQDEGLAEYSTLMFFENYPAYGFTRTGLVGTATKSYRAFFSVLSQLNGEVDTTMTRNLSAFTSEYEYTNVTYNKGLLLFETLRESLGDDRFVEGLRQYYTQCLNTIASAEDMIACFIKTGVDVEGLFASFTEGKIII